MSDASPPVATASQTVGPFFHFALATDDSLGRLAMPGTPGERIRLRVRVLDGDGLPVPDALVEIYQADASGVYAALTDGRAALHGAFTGFGRLPTDVEGLCTFETVKPGAVASAVGAQAPHVNVCLLARGLLRQVYTRVYFAGEAGHSEDPVLRLVPPGRAATLMARRLEDDTREADAQPAAWVGATWDFTIRLQGPDETVFFDL
jgi:protocatechuate 3,4-dioxygenase alpha subunit